MIEYKPNILPESQWIVRWLESIEKWKDYSGDTRAGRQAVQFRDDIEALWKFYHVCERSELDYKSKCKLAFAGQAIIFDANGNRLSGAL